MVGDKFAYRKDANRNASIQALSWALRAAEPQQKARIARAKQLELTIIKNKQITTLAAYNFAIKTEAARLTSLGPAAQNPVHQKFLALKARCARLFVVWLASACVSSPRRRLVFFGGCVTYLVLYSRLFVCVCVMDVLLAT